MKPFYLVVCLPTLIVVSCKNDDDWLYWGNATAIKNDVEWEARPVGTTAAAYPDGLVGILGDVYSKEGYKRETLSFGRVPLPTGIIALGIVKYPHNYDYVSTSFSTSIDDGDVSGDYYNLDTTAVDNYFEVVKYSGKNREIEIKFTSTYVISKKYHIDAPDTIRFRDGYIKTRILQ